MPKPIKYAQANRTYCFRDWRDAIAHLSTRCHSVWTASVQQILERPPTRGRRRSFDGRDIVVTGNTVSPGRWIKLCP